MQNHIKYVHEEGELKCGLCGNRYGTTTRLRAHEMLHMPYFSCSECHLGYPKRSTVKKHIEVQHLGIRPHTCTYCGKTYKVASHRNQHQRGCKEKMVCPLCQKGFKHGQSYDAHLIYQHGYGRICPQVDCNERFYNRVSLSQHLQKRHGQGAQTMLQHDDEAWQPTEYWNQPAPPLSQRARIPSTGDTAAAPLPEYFGTEDEESQEETFHEGTPE